MRIRGLWMSLVLIGAVGLAGADPLGTTFTYQGVLSDGGSPVSGDVDLRFSLWDAASGGGQVGSSIVIEDLAVSDGRVTVPLDFGAVFTGAELWLRVEVRDGASTGSYTVLDPRQALTAAPYAAHAIAASSADTATTASHASTAAHAASADTATTAGSATTADHATTADSATTASSATTAGHATSADSATTAGHAATADSATSATTASSAGDSDTLDGQQGSYYRAWSSLTGVPVGLDDGDDDTLAGLSCASGEVASWDGSAWVCSTPGGASYARTIIVGPVGDPAANGAALAAVASSITPPAGPADAVLIKVEPGEYDLGGASVALWNWVHMRGSGRLATRITSEACGPVSRVVSLDIGELSDLTVENTCTDPTATVQGISMGSIYPGARISRVTVVGSGAVDLAYGIYSGSDDLFVENVQIILSGATNTVGVEYFGNGLYLIDSIVQADGTSTGVALVLTDDGRTVVSRGSYTASGSSLARAMSVYGASIDATDCSLQGADASVWLYGMNGQQTGYLTRLQAYGKIRVMGDGVDPVEVKLWHSRIRDTSSTIEVNSGIGATVTAASTELDGGAVIGPVSCTAVWDEAGVFYPSTCP